MYTTGSTILFFSIKKCLVWFVCLFVLAYFRPGIITTRDIFRMQKIRVVILCFFLPQIKICTMISAFIDRRRRLILCYENDVEIIFHANVQLLFCLFVCLFVCFCLFVPPQLFWYDFLIFIRAASRFCFCPILWGDS